MLVNKYSTGSGSFTIPPYEFAGKPDSIPMKPENIPRVIP
jgi:hypothetical protein